MSQVIVVGGGLAGMSAAHTVVQNGGRVLVLDKSAFCGGNSTKATSGINAAGSRTQRMLKIPDAAEIFERDTAKSAGNLIQNNLVKVRVVLKRTHVGRERRRLTMMIERTPHTHSPTGLNSSIWTGGGLAHGFVRSGFDRGLASRRALSSSNAQRIVRRTVSGNDDHVSTHGRS